MDILIYILMIAAITLVFAGVWGSAKLGPKRIALPKIEGGTKKVDRSAYTYNFIPFSQKLIEKLNLDIKIKNKLNTAHVNLTPVGLINIKLLLMILFGFLSLFILRKFEPLVLTVAVGLGFILPDLWLNSKIRQRKFAIARVLPETVDLLGLCVEAGLDFITAVKWIIENKVSANPLIEELELALEEIKWGKPRSDALKDMAKRLNIPEVSSFVRALLQAERMGTLVTEAFSIISEDTRLQRFRRGERLALQAPIKILVPLVFCILVVIGIIIGGPILLQFTQGNLFGGILQ